MIYFLAITIALATLAHSLIPRFSVATAAAASTTVVINLLHESWGRWGSLGADDLFFWGPWMVVLSSIVSFTVSALIGLPFFAARVGLNVRPPDLEMSQGLRWSDWGRTVGRFL